MYNAYLATHQKPRKQREDSPATAGMAESPAGGPGSQEELKALGERNGWKSRELSLREINAMSADETLWHETFNRESLERAFTLAENQRLNKERMPILETRRMWSGRATPQEAEKAWTAGDQFATRFPQFERSVSNAKKMIEYMEKHDLDGTQLSSYVSAFHALTERGELTLVPALSADQFLAEHPELHDTRIPPLIAARHQREQNTESHFAEAASATSEAGVTRVVDYGEQKHGVPPESEKYSFRMKVQAMAAAELAQRCADDPAFKAALNGLD